MALPSARKATPAVSSLHSGRARSSSRRTGSVFWVAISPYRCTRVGPGASPLLAMPPAVCRMIQAAMTMSVLVVDDEAAVLEMLGRTLGRAGFAPAMALSGEQALELMQAQQFDAALVDKNLKGMDGIDLLRHVPKRQPRCACIVMTAYPSTSSAVEALRLGV